MSSDNEFDSASDEDTTKPNAETTTKSRDKKTPKEPIDASDTKSRDKKTPKERIDALDTKLLYAKRHLKRRVLSTAEASQYLEDNFSGRIYAPLQRLVTSGHLEPFSTGFYYTLSGNEDVPKTPEELEADEKKEKKRKSTTKRVTHKITLEFKDGKLTLYTKLATNGTKKSKTNNGSAILSLGDQKACIDLTGEQDSEGTFMKRLYTILFIKNEAIQMLKDDEIFPIFVRLVRQIIHRITDLCARIKDAGILSEDQSAQYITQLTEFIST